MQARQTNLELNVAFRSLQSMMADWLVQRYWFLLSRTDHLYFALEFYCSEMNGLGHDPGHGFILELDLSTGEARVSSSLLLTCFLTFNFTWLFNKCHDKCATLGRLKKIAGSYKCSVWILPNRYEQMPILKIKKSFKKFIFKLMKMYQADIFINR